MKKIYIIDLIMLMLNIVSFFTYTYFIGNMSRTALIIYALFLTEQIFINLRLKIVMKYTPKFNHSWKEYLYIPALFLAKIQFILVLLNDTSWLYWSILHFGFLSLFILDYSYISSDKLIYNLNKAIDIKDINHIEIYDKLFSTIYIKGCVKNQKRIKFKLSKKEFEYLEENMN